MRHLKIMKWRKSIENQLTSNTFRNTKNLIIKKIYMSILQKHLTAIISIKYIF